MATHPLLLLALLALPLAGQAQVADPLASYTTQRQLLMRQGMRVLGATAALNAVVGTALWVGNGPGTTQAFGQMHVGWAAVNLGLAAGGLLMMQRKPLPSTWYASMQQQQAMEGTFLFNSGLDVAYMLGGLALQQYGHNQADAAMQQRLQGWGQAVIVNGALLLVFDGAMYALLKRHERRHRQHLQRLQLPGQ